MTSSTRYPESCICAAGHTSGATLWKRKKWPSQSKACTWKIGGLYAVEEKIRMEHLEGEAVVKLRREKSYPIIKELEKWCKEEYGHTVDKSPIAKAMFYMYTRFEQLSGYVNDAQFCIDNNPVERSIRPLTLNRKIRSSPDHMSSSMQRQFSFHWWDAVGKIRWTQNYGCRTCWLGYRRKEREEKTITPIYCHLIGKDKQESYNKVKSQTCFVRFLTLL